MACATGAAQDGENIHFAHKTGKKAGWKYRD